VGQNPNVRVVEMRQRIQHPQQQEREPAADDDDETGEAKPVSENRLPARGGRAGIGVCGNHFLNDRMWAMRALISASLNPSAGFISTLPSLSLRPSLMALKAASSFISAWTLASV